MAPQDDRAKEVVSSRILLRPSNRERSHSVLVKQVVDVAEFVQREKPAHVESGPHLGSTWSRRRETSGCTFTVRLSAPDARALEDPFRWGGWGIDGIGGFGTFCMGLAPLRQGPGPVFTAPPRAAYY
jgi:hypothetical protein